MPRSLAVSQRRKGAGTQGAVEVLLVDVGISRNGAAAQRAVLLDVADFYSSVLLGNLQPPNVIAFFNDAKEIVPLSAINQKDIESAANVAPLRRCEK
ncbi:MAG: hypothetical protein ACO1NW_03945 [Chitinophagaceae bacterium]